MLLEKSFRLQGLNLPFGEFGRLPGAFRDQLHFFDLLLALVLFYSAATLRTAVFSHLERGMDDLRSGGGLWIKVLTKRI